MPKVHHGFDLGAIRAELDASDWEEDFDNPGTETRQVFLGTVFALTPSGKYYLPFACSNVDACETCQGTGLVMPRRTRRRIVKKHVARHATTMRRWRKRWGAPTGLYGRELTAHEAKAKAWLQSQPKAFRTTHFSNGTTCPACCGLGSREAHLDELWREEAESALETIGCSLQGGEGDPCDLFAAEYRDAEEKEEEIGDE